jgi:hypothetical protein
MLESRLLKVLQIVRRELLVERRDFSKSFTLKMDTDLLNI